MWVQSSFLPILLELVMKGKAHFYCNGYFQNVHPSCESVSDAIRLSAHFSTVVLMRVNGDLPRTSLLELSSLRNSWEHPDIQPDLSNASLRRTDLIGIGPQGEPT